ncbi:MAG: ABC transporter transmembrane domain-containing protein [Leptolyngbyaceae cyanobacterium]
MKWMEFKDRGPSRAVDEAHQLLNEMLWHLFPTNNDWMANFSQSWEIREFQLGDQLNSGEEPGTDHPDHSRLHLLVLGHVRLISLDLLRQQEIPVALLEAGEGWGADEWFCQQPLSYRAVGSSPGLVATLPIAQLEYWLEQVPQLQTHWQTEALARQQLIFFKAKTALRSQASHALKPLLPYLAETMIPAGATLAQATPTPSGHHWLKYGQIESQDSSHTLPKIGDSWGYPDQVPADWVAATDLWVYTLGCEHWETLQSLLSEAKDQPFHGQGSAADSGAVPTPGLKRRLTRRVAKPSLIQYTPEQSTHSTSHNPSQPDLPLIQETRLIDFAKPGHSRYQRPWFRPNYPFVPQQSSSDCGAACLAMIAQYWGKRLNLNILRNLAGVGRSGASLKGLANAAERLGFQSRPVHSSFNRLAEQTTPWIAHWQGDHYVVVYRVKGNKVMLSDPALGRRSLSLADFQASWTGYALLLSPTELLAGVPNSKPSLSRILGAFWPYRSMLWPILLASVLLQVFGLVTPLFTQIILDRVVVHKSLLTLQVFAIGLLMFGIWRIGLTGIRQYLLDYFSNQIDLTLISGFISHALNLPLQFFATRHVGDIVTRVQENHKIQQFLTRQAITAWLDATMAIVYVGLMLYYNWQLTLLVLGLLPPIIILTVLASPFLRRVSRQIFYESAKQNSTLVEILTGIFTIKATGAERDLRWQWEEQLTGLFNAQWRGQKLANGLQIMSSSINTLGSTALLWYGATLVIRDQLSIGQFVAFNMMIGNVIGPVIALVGLWDEFQEVMVSVERLDDIFSVQPEESPDQPLLILPSIRGEVTFENVTFRYNSEDDRNILQNISFTVQPGETIAIVGRSGSGKTTLVNLLQGLYQPTSGRVTVDSNDLRHVSPHSFRSQLGVVPQDCYLFSGSILENITLYRPEYSLERVLEVAKLAEAHAFIQNLPLGYNTKVGERGATLSGGQRQRIAIARALISNPRILILDEATSSLDTESEQRFQKNLQTISRDRTTFIIAHRLSTVRHADCILVLDRGVIVEKGNHAQLMEKQGLYAQLTQQQLNI